MTLGLYHQDTSHFYTVDKKQVSALLITTIHDILREHATKITDLQFIGAHAGPAPFTTLRSALATVNGIAFTTHIPLVAVNGLDAFCTQNQEVTLILNAFCEDIYYGYYDKHTDRVEKRCVHIEDFLKHDISNMPSTFVGNGTQLFEAQLRAAFGARIHIPTESPLEPSTECIAEHAHLLWQQGQSTDQIIPEYMKQYSTR